MKPIFIRERHVGRKRRIILYNRLLNNLYRNDPQISVYVKDIPELMLFNKHGYPQKKMRSKEWLNIRITCVLFAIEMVKDKIWKAGKF